jgi:hypothetical protein
MGWGVSMGFIFLVSFIPTRNFSFVIFVLLDFIF